MASMQIEGDRRLLKFDSYEAYLDSLITCKDLSYLQSIYDARTIAELGYRSSGDTLTREEFIKRFAAVHSYFFPKMMPTDLLSKHVEITENFLQELANREKGNKNGYLATIIFIRHYTKAGFEVSGYIDYADRLRHQDWLPIYQGKKRLWPRTDDLSFYHWRNKTITMNNSLNFKVVIDPVHGLQFQCWHDRKYISVNPNAPVTWHTTRTTIPTDKYEHVVLLDHLIRRRC